MGSVLLGIVVGALLAVISLAIHVGVMRLAARSEKPLPVVVVGFILRISVFVAALLWLGGSEWQILAAALAAFAIVRVILMYYVGLAGRWGNIDPPLEN